MLSHRKSLAKQFGVTGITGNLISAVNWLIVHDICDPVSVNPTVDNKILQYILYGLKILSTISESDCVLCP